MHTIRKLCSFDGFFDEFVYCDSDNLIMKKFDDIGEDIGRKVDEAFKSKEEDESKE